MNGISIFSYLKSYIPSEGRDPKEDYLTQMFAYILENIEEAGRIYVEYLYERLNTDHPVRENEMISVSTQEVLRIDDGMGRIDLLIKVGEQLAFICEHKVFSELSECQIEKYMQNASQLGNRQYYSVLVTFSPSQWKQPSDIAIIWSDIYVMLEERIIQTNVLSDNAVSFFIVSEFLKYLKENGMAGYSDITSNMITSWFAAQKLEESLKGLFSELASVQWDQVCPLLRRDEFSEYAPAYNGMRWGRVGIDFHKWGLGVFAGVILDTKDHGLEPIDENTGPDFVIFIDSAYSKTGDDRQYYEENISLDYIRERRQILENNSGEYDYIPGLASSPYRIAVLRRPLLEVLSGKYTREEQKNALKEAIISGINRMLGE